MATQGTPNADFVDIHTKVEPTATKYLSEELINNWKRAWVTRSLTTEKDYVETDAYIQAKKRLWYSGWVTLCGYPGDGKSCTADHLLCNFVRGPWKYPKRSFGLSGDTPHDRTEKRRYLYHSLDEADRPCYNPVFVKTPEDYKSKVDPNLDQIVIIDDIFGKGALNWSLVERWRPILEDMLWDISTRRPKTLVIMCVSKAHLERAPGEIKQLEWFRKGVMIDFSSTHKPGEDDGEKLVNACGSFGVSRQEMENSGVHRAREGAPLLYKMRYQVQSFAMEGPEFFKNPWQLCRSAIDKVYRFDRIFYFTLSVAVLLDGEIDLSKSTMAEYDDRTRKVMEQLITILDIPANVDLGKMRYAGKMLTGFFLEPIGEWRWRYSHPKVFQMCAQSLCRKDAHKVLELASTDFILNYVRAWTKFENREHELVIECTELCFDTLVLIFINGILSGHMKEFVQNESCANEIFVAKWFETMKNTSTLDAIIHQKDVILNRSLFYWACYYGQGPVVKEILDFADTLNLKANESFVKEMEWGLQAACASNANTSHIAVKSLLEHGVNLNKREKYEGENAVEVFGKEMIYLTHLHAPPIHVAALRGHPESVKALIEKGANVSAKTEDGLTPIHRAAMRRDTNAKEVIKALIEKNADVNAKTPKDRTPLSEAVCSGCRDTVEVLVNAGADLINGYVEDGRSYIAVAVQSGQSDLVQYLINNKVNINGRYGGDAFSPLALAIQNRDPSMVDTLLMRQCEVDHLCSNGWSALHVAAFLGEYEIARKLISHHADVNREAHDKKTPLHLAAMKGLYSICDLLLDHGAKTEVMSSSQETPVVLAAKGNHEMVVWLLLKEGMELDGGGNDIIQYMMRDLMYQF